MRKRIRQVDSASEGVRRKYLYRTLIINNGVKLPSRLALKLVGPDCAYHLYRNHHPDDLQSEEDQT